MSQTITFKWDKDDWSLLNDLGLTRRLNLLAAQSAAGFMNPYVPADSGILSQNFTVQADENEGRIIYKSPYAHYQYYGELMLAPNGSAWAKRGEKKHYAGKPLKYSKQMHPPATDHWDKAMMNAKKDVLLKEVSDMRKRLAK